MLHFYIDMFVECILIWSKVVNQVYTGSTVAKKEIPSSSQKRLTKKDRDIYVVIIAKQVDNTTLDCRL